MNFSRFILVLSVLVLMLHKTHAETIQEITNPKHANNSWVSDMANVLSTSTKQRINIAIDQLERKNGAEMAVVTVNTTDGSTPKQFATRLFNDWGIGKREHNNGVLMLLVMGERRIEVETGSGLSRILPDDQVQDILRQDVIPHFRDSDYDRGVLSGTLALIQVLERPPIRVQELPPLNPEPAAQVETPQEAPMSAPFVDQENRDESHETTEASSGGWFKKLVAIVLLPFGGWLMYRSKQRYCTQCKQKMRRLSESEDDALLGYEQKFEEQLGSVDYRVWKCNPCQTLTAERSVKWMSGYDTCPQCKHVTLASQTTILRHPTYTRTGESLVTHTCRFPRCRHSYQERYILPVETPPQERSSSNSVSSRSSSSGGSSSSGSFGGGSSRGGGAGASW